MKKLSEIGSLTMVSSTYKGGWVDPAEATGVFLTKDERRELVESAIAGFITKEIESRTSLYILQTRLPAFLEEQGL